ncbi:hypothetical protein Sxan_06340 [Streptomyces xanthophaeus]|uniref:Uncharacterized protein n=1 Tax=Streptomyces xanthophaeus TaxID=67385 RepID=A0A919LAX3_9ACTN|nr:hypothetical protein Sxan_06340 [Streptomyces xanthophaeus]
MALVLGAYPARPTSDGAGREPRGGGHPFGPGRVSTHESLAARHCLRVYGGNVPSGMSADEVDSCVDVES